MAEGDAVKLDIAEQAGMDLTTALGIALKKAHANDGLARGLHECAKALEKRTAHLCLLASDCDNAAIKALVNALCEQNDIRLLEVDSREELGRLVGLVKTKADGEEKVVNTSVAVVRNWGEDSEALAFLLNHLKK
eukprot:TRINITY_DN39456_c0_g1_i1.p2 TRINITY_DN39456_c0_g1~~TRINITY_DN39456_c0_g1_i1.p2  ORF type:complete len:135 (+),score=29.65 TRINITY_DN39456_c0_g1_i1:126-530(+)